MNDMSHKLEKLASAVYLVTGFFDDKEPLKWKLRSLSADLVANEVKDKSIVGKEILSLFSVAKNAGLVSETNYDILARELSKLEYETKRPLELMFRHEAVANERALPEPQAVQAPGSLQARRVESQAPEPIKDKTDEKLPLREFGAVSVKKNSRQSIIIGILKRKKEIMIKDVTPMVSGCSEKTIQRELGAMVQAGVLKKVGEKRWSRYTLA